MSPDRISESARHRVAARPSPRRRRAGLLAGLASGAVAAAVGLFGVGGSPAAYAAEPTVGLGTAAPFAVLAGTTVTNTGPTVISGDLGVSPGTAITGFPPGQVLGGAPHSADAVALQAQDDLTTAYGDAAGRTPATAVSSDLGGQTLVGGVYQTAAAMALTGTVTLDAQGDPDTVFVFQAGSTLTTATASTVALVNGAQACNVFWQVGSSATLGTDTTFNGTVMALTSITVQTRTTVEGRLLARNGAVTLDTNTVTRPSCAAAPTATPSTPAATATPTPTDSATPSATITPSATLTPSATPTGGANATPTAPGSTAGSAPTTPTSPSTPSPSTPSQTPPGTSTTSRDDSPPDYDVPVGHPETGREGTPSAPGR